MIGIPGPEPRPGLEDDVPYAVALHCDRIGEGFLVRLGPRFLRRLYRRIVRAPGSFLLVTEDRAGVDGFVAVASDTARLYREFLLRDGVPAAIAAAPAVLRSPREVWETFRYGTSDDTEMPRAEILAVAVATRSAGRGRGGALVAAALDELGRRGVPAAHVVTAETNTAARRTYERAGFRRHSRTEVHRGIPQEVLVWP